jgi:transposase
MMATLAIGGLDSTKLQDVKRRREREKRKKEMKTNTLKKRERERERERKEKVRSDHLESVLNHMSPAKVRFYEGNCTSTLCLYTGVD